MRAQQVVYTSAVTHRGRGYHLVSRSPGIGQVAARQLTQWSPSHGALLSDHPEASSINFFPLQAGQLALSRTFFGGPEYSGRGGLQVITHALVVTAEQLEGYQNNPIDCIRTALSLGCLHLRPAYPPQLPTVELPDRWCTASVPPTRVQLADPLVEHALDSIARNQRLAVVWKAGHALDLIEAIILRLPVDQRLNVSFSSGLKPSVQRPFRLHVLPSIDLPTRRRLSAQGTCCIDQSPQDCC